MDPYEDIDDESDDPISGLSETADPIGTRRHDGPAGDTPHLRTIDRDGRLIRDTPCIHCDYNLRGQLPAGVCPECGAPVAASLRTDLLCQANPRWLGALKSGMTWLIVGVFVSLGLTGVNMIVAFSSGMANPNPSNPFATPVPLLITQIITALIQTLIFVAGYWLLTEPEPGALNPTNTRGIARWTLITGFSVGLLSAFAALGQSQAAVMIGSVINLVGFILLMIGLVATLVYLRGLARRVPDAGLAKQTSIVLWGLPISLGGLIVGGVVAGLVAAIALAQPGPNSAGGTATGILAITGVFICPAILGTIVFGIWWMVLMFFYRARFADACNTAGY